MLILLTTLDNQVHIFHARTIGEIVQQICKFIDLNILTPEDLEQFIDRVRLNANPSMYRELCLALTNGVENESQRDSNNKKFRASRSRICR